ncbi:MAG: hypothetical protein H7A49_14055 [Akkermansiaceae bacterium]|nr:hypothetical protein [Akkermansiaceae bacterium]
MSDTHPSRQPSRPRPSIGSTPSSNRGTEIADFEGESVGSLEENAAGHHHAAAETGARRDIEQPALMGRPVHPLAEGRRVAVVGREHRLADVRGEPAADVRSHPVVAEVRLAPDDAVRTRSRNVQTDRGDGIDLDSRVRREHVERAPQLPEGLAIALLHQTRDLDDFADRFARGVDKHAFDGGASDIQSGEVGFHVGGKLSEAPVSRKFRK